MLEKLKKRWQVNTLGLFLIILTFALGGTLCGIAGKRVMLLTGMEKNITWYLIYILIISILWPACVLLISIPLGQYLFFSAYLLRVKNRIFGKNMETKNIAIFASGAGSNAQKIIDRFRNSSFVNVALIICNKEGAGVKHIAENENIPFLLIDKERFFRGDSYLPELENKNISLIVLAGFLWKIPLALIKAFPQKIINIHPALLPKYGGKGMYGQHVHSAVIAAGEKESGISIHFVDEIYDHGKTIFQATCPIDENDNPESLAQKIHQLEHKHFPEVVEQLLLNEK